LPEPPLPPVPLLVLVADVILANGVGAGDVVGALVAFAKRRPPEVPDVLVLPVSSKKLKGNNNFDQRKERHARHRYDEYDACQYRGAADGRTQSPAFILLT